MRICGVYVSGSVLLVAALALVFTPSLYVELALWGGEFISDIMSL